MKNFSIAVATAASILALSTAASAHTVSYGYLAGANPGEVDFWFGSYHPYGVPTLAAIPIEGALDLVGVNGTTYASQQFTFDLKSVSLPTGLVTDDNYFYADTATVYRNDPSLVYSWMGVTVTGLDAGDYQFSFVDVNTTAFWDNWDSSLNAPFTLTSGNIGGGGTQGPSVVPLPAALPLMASGFGLMGFFGLRKSKKKSS